MRPAGWLLVGLLLLALLPLPARAQEGGSGPTPTREEQLEEQLHDEHADHDEHAGHDEHDLEEQGSHHGHNHEGLSAQSTRNTAMMNFFIREFFGERWRQPDAARDVMEEAAAVAVVDVGLVGLLWFRRRRKT